MPVINSFPTDGEYVDLVSDQVIDGQKDFEDIPRAKVGSDYKSLLTTADKSIYWCTKGSTTYTEVEAALSNGQLPCVMYNDHLYIYQYQDSSHKYIFVYINVNACDTLKLSAPKTWSTGTYTFEITSNKKNSLSSSSTNTQYPSAKCVYDALPKYYTQDGWTYRKWPNNFVELWKTSSEYTVSQNTFNDHPWGTLYHSASYVNNAWVGVVTDSYTYPITFAEDPNISVTLCATGDGNGWLATAQTGSNPDIKQATPRYFVVRPTPYGVKFKVCFYITGFESVS